MLRKTSFYGLLILLLLQGCLSPGHSGASRPYSAEVTGNRLEIQFSNQTTLTLTLKEDGWLGYRLDQGSPLPSWSQLWKTSRDLTGTWTKAGSAWTSGPWEVRLSGTGVEIFTGGKLLSSLHPTLDGDILRLRLNAGRGENWYGLGGTTTDPKLTPGSHMLLQKAAYGDQTYLYIPWVFTDAGDGFYFNAHGADQAEVGDEDSGLLEIATFQGVVDGIFRHNPSPKSLTSDFYRWSGSRSLLPRWAYGFLQSKYGYRNTQEVLDVVQGFNTRGIPLSGIVLDLYWFRRMGDYSWNTRSWDPDKLDRELEAAGIKTLAITEPYFTEDSRLYEPLKAAGALVKDQEGVIQKWSSWWAFGTGEGGIVNPLEPGAQKILGQAYKDMKLSGIDGYWTDLGEPEENPQDGLYGEYPSLQFHNYYNYYWNKILHTALREQDPNFRPFILSRSGYTGSAGLGVSVWSGDVASEFESLAKHPALGITAGLTGFSFWGSDVGGFISRGLPDKELFVRWHQLGLVSPVYRAHGAQSPREPWIHGEDTAKIVGDIIRLRHRLLPYIYTAAWQTWSQGLPMMRPLWFEHPDLPEAWNQPGTYYFGDSLVTHPVVEPGVTEVSTWLPPGEWTDWFTGKKIIGGKQVNLPVTLETFPLLIKAGSIIPLESEGKITYRIFPDPQGQARGLLYQDDGVTEAYRKGPPAKVLRLSGTAVITE